MMEYVPGSGLLLYVVLAVPQCTSPSSALNLTVPLFLLLGMCSSFPRIFPLIFSSAMSQ